MNLIKHPVKYLFLLLILPLLLTACLEQAPPDDGPTIQGTLLPAIKAGACTLNIADVQRSDRYPPNCVSGTENCLQMEAGDELLLVFFTAQGSCDLQALTDQMAFEQNLYLLSVDGTRNERLVTGVEGDVFALGFSLVSPPNNLLLVWEGNPNIKLPAITP